MNEIRPCGNNEKWCESCVSKGKCNYTKNQDIIDELEKIKAEIEEKEFKLNCATMSDVALKTAYSEVAKLLDNHISELKGENNE